MLRVAVIGAGNWGFQHARAYFERPDTELVAVVGRTEARTRARAEYFHTHWYLDVEEMLEKEKPDFVSVCLPAQHTFETTMKVIKAGVPLLAEKPLAYRLDEARALVEAAEEKNLFFAIDFNQRYSHPYQKTKACIENGALGTPVFIHWRFGHGWGSDVIDHPYLNLIEAQCHGLDLVEHLFGPVAQVSAEMTENGGKQSNATISLSLKFENGAVGSFLGTLDANEYNQLSQLLEVCGTKGRILAEDNLQSYSFQPNDSQTAEVWRPAFFDDGSRSFGKNLDRHLNDLIPALLAGKEPPVPARKGLRALELAYAAIESYEKGIKVKTQPAVLAKSGE